MALYLAMFAPVLRRSLTTLRNRSHIAGHNASRNSVATARLAGQTEQLFHIKFYKQERPALPHEIKAPPYGMSNNSPRRLLEGNPLRPPNTGYPPPPPPLSTP